MCVFAASSRDCLFFSCFLFASSHLCYQKNLTFHLSDVQFEVNTPDWVRACLRVKNIADAAETRMRAESFCTVKLMVMGNYTHGNNIKSLFSFSCEGILSLPFQSWCPPFTPGLLCETAEFSPVVFV